MLKNRKKKGQSTLEYIILVTAVIAVVIVFLGPGSPFRSRVNAVLETTSNRMQNMADRLSASRPLSP